MPTLNVSAIDVVIEFSRNVTASEINALLEKTANGPLKNLLAFSNEPHASIDFNHDPHSAIVDGSQTHAAGLHLVNLLLWFDNEWGFANRMVEVAGHWLKLDEAL